MSRLSSLAAHNPASRYNLATIQLSIKLTIRIAAFAFLCTTFTLGLHKWPDLGKYFVWATAAKLIQTMATAHGSGFRFRSQEHLKG